MAEKIYKGDVGTEFRVDTECDISGFTVAKIKVLKPNADAAVEWIVSETIDDRYLKYIIADGDLDVAGNYIAHAYVELPSGKWTGEKFNFEVFDVWG